MRILDIDLDFFLEDIAHWISDYNGRLDEQYTKIWSVRKVNVFLKNKCAISKNAPLRGKVVEHHNEAFYVWKDWINRGILSIPFEVVHVDAHSDLGLGDAGFLYIMTEMLFKDVDDRSDPKDIYPGNYLSFVAACRWINKLTLILHPKWENDLMWLYLKNYDNHSGFLQLKKYTKDQFNLDRIREIEPIDIEPEIPLELIELNRYVEKDKFDFLTVSQSPGYTPKSADAILDEIKKNIVEI